MIAYCLVSESVFCHSESQRVVARLISVVGMLNSEVSASEVRG